MTKFKVGDRVRLTTVNTYDRWGADGEEGTVVVADDGCDDCLVRFDKAGSWYAAWNILELVDAATTLTIEAGKTYKTRDGRKVGPMERWDEHANHPWEQEGGSTVFDSGGDIWKADGTSDYKCPDLVAEWGEEGETREPASQFKVGDVVEFIEDNPNSGPEFGAKGARAKVVRGPGVPDYYGVQVKVAFDGQTFEPAVPVSALRLAAPATPKIGDWVRDDRGDIGIVFHDDGTCWLNLQVGMTESGGLRSFDATNLTVVPAGTVKAAPAPANDNYQVHDIVEIAAKGYFTSRVNVGDLATVTGFDEDGDLRIRVNTSVGPIDQLARRNKGDIRTYRRAA